MPDTHLRKVGRRYRFKSQEFWAEDGMVCMEDRDDGEFVAYSVKEARDRFRAIGQMYTRADTWSTSDSYFKDLRPEYRNLLLDFDAVVKDAVEQGDPTAELVVQKKQAAETKTQLMAGQGLNPGFFHGGAAGPLATTGLDPRAQMRPGGRLWLPHGGGKREARKHYGPGV